MTEPRDELLERYADAVAQDPRKPSDRVRNAARAHAQMLRDQATNAVQTVEVKPNTTQPAANQSQWKLSLVASLAVIGFAGLIYVQIDHGTPDEREAGLGVAAPAPTPTKAAAEEIAHKEEALSPKPAPEPTATPTPTQIAAKATSNATARRADPAQTVNAPDATQESDKRLADTVSDSARLDEARVQGFTEASARKAPAAHVAVPPSPVPHAPPAPVVIAPPPPAPAVADAAPALSPAPRLSAAPRARNMQTASPSAAFLEAARTGNTDGLQQLLTQGVAINTRDDNGNTALMLAVRHQQVSIVRTLLAMGADSNLTNREGLTALQLANQLGLADMVQLLQEPR
ncbi:MAG: ankyrin repeat domain-containing protein [Rhodoferax sp.]